MAAQYQGSEPPDAVAVLGVGVAGCVSPVDCDLYQGSEPPAAVVPDAGVVVCASYHGSDPPEDVRPALSLCATLARGA